MEFKSLDDSVRFVDGGFDENGDHIIYMDLTNITNDDPFEVEFDYNVLTDIYWSETQGMWIIESGKCRTTVT